MIVKVKKVKNQGWGTNQVKAYEGTKTKVIPSIDRNGNYNTGLTVEDEARLEPLLGLQKVILINLKRINGGVCIVMV